MRRAFSRSSKDGLLPAHTLAIEQLLKHLYCRLPDPEKPLSTINIIDPCELAKARPSQIRKGLNVNVEKTYAVELDAGRAGRSPRTSPASSYSARPASSAARSPRSLRPGLCQPAFRHRTWRRGREEQAFAERAAKLLAIKGVIVSCAVQGPHRQPSFCEFMDCTFENSRSTSSRTATMRSGSRSALQRDRRHRPQPKEALPRDKLMNLGTLHKMYPPVPGLRRASATSRRSGQSQPNPG